MKQIKSKAEQDLYEGVIHIVAAEAPSDWTIAVLKFEIVYSVPRQCRITLEYVDSTGHVIWYEVPRGALHDLEVAALRFQALAPDQGGEEPWTRASLTLSAQAVISADFWMWVEAE